MRRAVLTALALIASLVLPIGPGVRAQDGAAALETLTAGVRTARAYLRTGNGDLAALELDRLAAEWPRLAVQLGAAPPTQLAGRNGYATWLESTGALVQEAAKLADAGQLDGAADTLSRLVAGTAALRRTAGWYALADAVEDQSAAMQALLRAADAGQDVVAVAQAQAEAFRRCDQLADPATRHDPQFRRIVDGALTSLAQVPETVRDGDTGRLRRILIELGAFDRLLAFRWG